MATSMTQGANGRFSSAVDNSWGLPASKVPDQPGVADLTTGIKLSDATPVSKETTAENIFQAVNTVGDNDLDSREHRYG